MYSESNSLKKKICLFLQKLPFANECDLSKQSTNDYSLQSQSSAPYGMGTSAYNTLQYVQMQAESANMTDPDPEVQFVSSNDKDEIINLDANESRSSSPRHDRYCFKSFMPFLFYLNIFLISSDIVVEGPVPDQETVPKEIVEDVLLAGVVVDHQGIID